jgi:hypothetical protein
MVSPSHTENVQTGAPRHLQVENHSVWIYLLDAAKGFRDVARSSHKLRSGYFLEQIRQTFHDCTRIIGDKDFHLRSPRELSA